MRPADAAVIAILESGEPFVFADCFTIMLRSGTILRYTNAQLPLRFTPPGDVAPRTFVSRSVIIDGMSMRSVRGIEVDEQDCLVSAPPETLVDGVPFMSALRLGQFDGGIILRDRAYLQNWASNVAGAIRLFSGRVSAIDPGGDTKAMMKVKSELIVLDQEMPRNAFQMSCKHTLFDAGCTLIKGDFATTDVAGMGSTRGVIEWAGATAGEFDLGTMHFETGANVGQQRTIRRSNGTQIILVFPFDNVPVAGDQFKVFPGCDYTRDRCENFFNNLDNFRGFPFVPVAETAL